MKFSALVLLGCALSMADDPKSPLADRSQRTFHPSTVVGKAPVTADILVAYQGVIPAGFDVKKLFEDASKLLHQSTKGEVQLGMVTIVPASPKSDPDILIIDGACPGQIKRSGDQKPGKSEVCADAHTGGYVGSKWWEDTKVLATGEAFNTIVKAEGAHITVSWTTLQEYGAPVLVHEFGHYLFSMRDEYEGTALLDDQSNPSSGLLGAAGENPSPTKSGSEAGASTTELLGSGKALADASDPFVLWHATDVTKRKTDFFNGFAMGYVSLFNPSKGFSPYRIASLTNVNVTYPTGSAPEGTFKNPTDLEWYWWVPEQFASLATRGNSHSTSPQFRYGGLWSMVTSIRTVLPSYVPSAPMTVDGSYTSTHDDAANVVNVYTQGQGNIFVIDRSGSMTLPVQNGYYAGFKKWQLAMDFFGRMTHPSESGLIYQSSARWGVVSFSSAVEEPAGLDYENIVAGVKKYRTITDLAVATTLTTDPAPKKLEYMTTGKIADPSGNTFLVDALNTAKVRLNNDGLYQRNVILISDGLDNPWPAASNFTGNEAKDGSYRVFAVTVDTKNEPGGYGEKMQWLTTRGKGPDGLQGKAYFTSEATDAASGQFASIAKSISDELRGSDAMNFGEALLYRDAAREYTLATDPGQTSASFSVAWTGAVAPVIYLTRPDGQTLTEAGGTGVACLQKGSFKSCNVDLSKVPAGQWKLRVTTNSPTPTLIFPTASVKGEGVQMVVEINADNASSTGKLPVFVAVKNGSPILGLDVVATLVNKTTGVTSSVVLKPSSTNGSLYTGEFSGTIQPGLALLTVTARHPNNNKVFFQPGENGAGSVPTPVAFFQPRTQSREVFITGSSAKKSVVALEAVMKQEQESNAQGTNFKIFLKNNSALKFAGLKVRYFFSVTEIAGGNPGWNPNYLPGKPTVKVGNVSGRPGLSYVELSYPKTDTLRPGASSSNGTNGGDQLMVIESSWKTPWNPGNDYSFTGLKTSWTANPFVNIYDESGNLLVGNPDLDPIAITTNAKPIVSLTQPGLVVAGTSATFTAEAIDPDLDPLTYTWIVDNVVVVNKGASNSLTTNTLAAGAHALSVVVEDGKGGLTKVDFAVQVQSSIGACTEAASVDLGVPSTAKVVTLGAGVNCFKVSAEKLNREWKWQNVVFQANSTGATLSGVSVQSLPVGSVTNLTGYSQSVNFADPGVKKALFIKVVSNVARTTTLNWWLQ